MWENDEGKLTDVSVQEPRAIDSLSRLQIFTSRLMVPGNIFPSQLFSPVLYLRKRIYSSPTSFEKMQNSWNRLVKANQVCDEWKGSWQFPGVTRLVVNTRQVRGSIVNKSSNKMYFSRSSDLCKQNGPLCLLSFNYSREWDDQWFYRCLSNKLT